MNIPSISSGKVIQVFNNNKTAGNGVIVQMPDGTNVRYIHMKNAPKVKVGDSISIGQSLGQIGSTGRSTGPHLDLTVTKGGKTINPMTIINSLGKSGGSNPVNADNKGNKQGTVVQSSYTNTYKTKKEALKSPDYQSYKGSLSQAVQAGKVPIEWVQGITELIGRESTWNHNADNGSHKGYGQFSADNIKTYEKKSGMSYSNPVGQIVMTAMYIKDRYGTPEKALQKWDSRSPHWY